MTGAVPGRPGIFEAAGRGTIFLGEVDEIPLPLLVKILHALEDREVHRVGEHRSRPINVRIIAAMHKELIPEMATRGFREDLYDRLKGVKLAVPPLRERHEDILPLARVLLAEASTRMKRAVAEFTGSVANHLLGYPWPGNVRELANVMELLQAKVHGES